MDNNEIKIQTEVMPMNYKKEYLIGLCLLIGFIFIHLILYGHSNDYQMLFAFFGIRLLLNRHSNVDNWREYFVFFLPLLSYSLLRFFYIYIPIWILLCLFFGILLIYYAIKENSDKKNMKIVLVIATLLILFSGEYYIYSTSLLKNSDLEYDIKKIYEIKQPRFIPLTEDDLNNIHSLNIYDLNNLNGIEHLNSLNNISFNDEHSIVDYKPLLNCRSLKTISFSHVNLKRFRYIGTFPNLESLEIIYPEKGSLDDMPYFPDAKDLYIHTDKPISLSVLKNFPKVERFALSVEGIPDFDGIENLTNLKELILYDHYIEDYDMLLNIPTLEKITLATENIAINDGLISSAKAKGIEVEMIKNTED